MIRPGPQYRSPIPDGPDVVLSSVAGYFYTCPDVASVDAHMAFLKDTFLSSTSNLTEFGRARWRLDFDRLIDRRLWLSMIETEEAA